MLCANVIEDLFLKRPLDVSLGYFFCKFDETALLKTREIVGSLTRQLLKNVSTKTLKINLMNINTGYITPDIEQILSNILLLFPRHKQYFLMLDGLDECDFEEVKLLIESIQSLFRSFEYTFKIFWTNRSDFASLVTSQFKFDFQIHISPSNNGPEISRFIKLALENALESNKLKLRDSNIVFSIQDDLEAETQKMYVLTSFNCTMHALSLSEIRFFWVAFQIDSICVHNTDHDILKCLEDLPKGLPATFRRVFRRLQHSIFADPSLGRTFFEIVAAA